MGVTGTHTRTDACTYFTQAHSHMGVSMYLGAPRQMTALCNVALNRTTGTLALMHAHKNINKGTLPHMGVLCKIVLENCLFARIFFINSGTLSRMLARAHTTFSITRILLDTHTCAHTFSSTKLN